MTAASCRWTSTTPNTHTRHGTQTQQDAVAQSQRRRSRTQGIHSPSPQAPGRIRARRRLGRFHALWKNISRRHLLRILGLPHVPLLVPSHRSARNLPSEEDLPWPFVDSSFSPLSKDLPLTQKRISSCNSSSCSLVSCLLPFT